jgi:hypothetical protein
MEKPLSTQFSIMDSDLHRLIGVGIIKKRKKDSKWRRSVKI